ncbi:hypothetical protein TRFO_40576 [Tritrichomonas foetus]|uniref:HMG box domain-containing protein n=1 Tax=Tritrichomonas foetus TaxID=1144522 RepID=A0A1J4J7D6_9EUKA|nr:hypothetical protein TRFO_40576 [Tritrichomonas foetus]|eukprot:OHS93108.1 hypothetical protein TRFO_40576 [Tritrichomonas foetus]
MNWYDFFFIQIIFLCYLLTNLSHKKFRKKMSASFMAPLEPPMATPIALSTPPGSHVEPFQIFCLERRPEIVRQHPQLTSSKVTSLLGTLWRATSPAVKRYYIDVAASARIPQSRSSKKKQREMTATMATNVGYSREESGDSAGKVTNGQFHHLPPPQIFECDLSKSGLTVSEKVGTYTHSSFLSPSLPAMISSSSQPSIPPINSITCNSSPEISPSCPVTQIGASSSLSAAMEPPLNLFIIPRAQTSSVISEISMKSIQARPGAV